MKYITLYFILIGTYGIHAQQGTNPFEIIRTGKVSTDSIISATIGSSNVSNSQKSNENRFEVYREDDNAHKSIQSNSIDSIDTKSANSSDNSISIEVDIDSDDMDYMSNNPFEVSHVPYRRSELKKQSNIETDISTANEEGHIRSIVNVKSTNNTFIFWLVLFTLLLLAIVVNVQRSAISKVAKSITNENVLKLSKREENGGLTGHYIMLYVMFFINLSCFIYLIAKYYNGFNGFRNWLLIFGSIGTVYLIRHISMVSVGKIFDITKDSSLYSFTIMTFNIFLGLVLIPINLVVAFSPTEIGRIVMYIGIGLILILLLIRIARGLLIGVRFMGEHLFQFFLYLCTFEIAPILILLRILGDQ